MPIGEVVFIFDWASECLCDNGPRVSGHLRISLGVPLKPGKTFYEAVAQTFYDVVVHLEAVRKKAEEVASELELERVPDELLAFEVVTTIIHESIHCAIWDAFVTKKDIEEYIRYKTHKRYFEELVIEALSYWSVLGVFARASALFHRSLEEAGDKNAQVRLFLEGVEFMDKMTKVLEEGKPYPDFLRNFLKL